MQELTLKLCGDPCLTVVGVGPSGQPLGAKALALLTFLALEPGRHRREELTALLWGEFPETRAKASLRQALTHVKDAIGVPLRADRSTVELTGSVSCDVTDFVRLAREDPAAALAIDVSQFLANLPIRNAPSFADWADAKRRDLVSQYVRLLATRAGEQLHRREWREAAKTAERWCDLEPLSDEPVAMLMQAQFLGDERESALVTHARHVARLHEAAGRTPSRSIAELAERIRQDGSVRARSTSAPGSRRGDGPVFTANLVGRAREWQTLQRVWGSVAGGASGIVVIDGDPGVGKSRLAEEFLRWVTSQGGVVMRGRGYDAHAGVPFGSIIELLRSAVDAPGVAGVDPEWLAELARVLPELRRRFVGLPETSQQAGGADSWRLSEAIAQVITAVAEDSPLAIFVDDMQWCDADSCGLLRFLVRRLAEAQVLWCGAFTVGSVDRDAPAARLSRALRAMHGTVSIPLEPLDEEAVWQMIREMGRVEAPTGARRLATRLHDITAGNPFYVMEVLKTLFARDLLAVDPASGGWIVRPIALADAGGASIAPTLHETISERIECLDSDLRALLISIAVAGHGIRTDVLSHVHGISRLRAAATGDALAECHLVIEDHGLYRCAHPIIAHVVRAGLNESRRREVHRAIAFAMEIVYGVEASDGYAGAIARHASHAGEPAMAYRYSLRALESSCNRGVFDEALSWIDLAAATAATPEESAIVKVLHAQVLQQAGWREAPSIIARTALPLAQMEKDDLDLPGNG